MCRFFRVSCSGYYKWKNRTISYKDRELIANIKECQKKHKFRYGYRRVTLWLEQEKHLYINHKKVLRVMQENYLLSEIRRVKAYYYKKQGIEIYQNLLNRNFKCDTINQKWGTDISFIKTKKGIVYLSIIKDLYDNFIVAYQISKTQSQQLVSQTLQKAIKHIQNGLILHSDRGFQYTSYHYKKQVAELNITPSMSRARNPLDNASVENFFSILKTESVYRQNIQDIHHATTLIDEFVEYYNYHRIQLKTKQTPFQKRCLSN